MESDKEVLDSIRIAYADSWMPFEVAKNVRNLNFRASRPLYPGESIRQALDIIGEYNSFDPAYVLGAIAMHAAEVTVAREGSPALYIRPRTNLRGDGEARAALREALLRAHADEVDDEPDGTIRAWWD